ncbi:MAG: sigma-70 family RNA polymerase sigma factor [Acidobacteria bacterium]|nr:sigma-70 family RNA polymerase sigma factor [Acidobacteriota bacterium]MCI0567809.1 sigma-70 family RNA polymerase sigma factor [Acidobacteriota bacterium]
MERGIDPDLQSLMTRLADGDRSAFHPAFAVLWPILRRFTSRHLTPPEAEDAAQEALVKIFRQAARFDPTRSATAWVLGVAGFEIRTVRRKRQRRREAPEMERAVLTRPDPAPSPEDAVVLRDLEDALREALGGLSPEDVETLRLYAHGQRPPTSPGTFRKRVQRALARARVKWRITDERP